MILKKGVGSARPVSRFWILLFLARNDLGLKGVILSVAIWLTLLLVRMFSVISSCVFVAGQSLFDSAHATSRKPMRPFFNR